MTAAAACEGNRGDVRKGGGDMFAFDPTAPINASVVLFVFFMLLCLSVSIVGMIGAPEGEDDEADDMSAALRELAQLTDVRPRTNGQTAKGPRRKREWRA